MTAALAAVDYTKAGDGSAADATHDGTTRAQLYGASSTYQSVSSLVGSYDASYTVNPNAAIIAQYDKNTFDIEYNANGGKLTTVTGTPMQTDAEGDVIVAVF